MLENKSQKLKIVATHMYLHFTDISEWLIFLFIITPTFIIEAKVTQKDTENYLFNVLFILDKIQNNKRHFIYCILFFEFAISTN